MLLKTVPIVGCSHYNQYLNAQSLKGLLKVGYNNQSVSKRVSGCLFGILYTIWKPYFKFGQSVLSVTVLANELVCSLVLIRRRLVCYEV